MFKVNDSWLQTLYLELTHFKILNTLLDISVWMSHVYFKINMPKTGRLKPPYPHQPVPLLMFYGIFIYSLVYSVYINSHYLGTRPFCSWWGHVSEQNKVMWSLYSGQGRQITNKETVGLRKASLRWPLSRNLTEVREWGMWISKGIAFQTKGRIS